MSKIICEVCGTSFPDSASQCPICGYVSTAATENGLTENDEAMVGAGYTYIKGGRFSKSNVRKRAKAAPVEDIDEYGPSEDYEPEQKKSNTPLVVIAIILLIAIAAVALFITLRFFGPWAEQKDDGVAVENSTTTEQTTDDGLIECTKLEVSEYEIEIPEDGSYELKVIKEPADTTDEVTYTSQDPAIATVDEYGKITPVSTGTTTIVVTCGTQQIEINVSCQVKEEIPFILDQMELKLEYLDQDWILYSGEIPVADIEFSSDDEAVATFVEGVVYAKGEGETTVYAKYEDQTVSCKVICVFKEESTDPDDGKITEDGGNETDTEELVTTAPRGTGKKGYVIKTNFGSTWGNSPNFDVQHIVDGVLYLKLEDAYGSRVPATWKVINSSICELTTNDGVKITCKKSGVAFVVATTEAGETYILKITVS